MATIAVDMMGSDLGPEELAKSVKGQLKDDKEIKFILYGDGETLNKLFSDKDYSDRVKIVPTTQIVPMEVKPLELLRMRDSSMYQAVEAVRSHDADAVVSAGSSGGLVTDASIRLRNIEGVKRAGICAAFPTKRKGVPCIITDVGANNVNTAEDIVGFAKMGRIYCKYVIGNPAPKVYTLSNGLEEGKGTEEIVGAYKIMKETNFEGFEGNVEARNAIDGTHDVVATSGFVGNIFLKSTEGTAAIMNEMIHSAFKKNIFTMIGYLFAKGGFKDMKTTMNYRYYGGAILMGVNGIVVKAHGNSNEYAFYQAIGVAKKMIACDIINKIKEDFNA